MSHHHSETLGWTLDPLLTVPLALALLIYFLGWSRLSKRAATPIRPLLFLSGWAVLALSLTSPLHEAGEQSFTMHMIEHELIMLVATLLLAASGAAGCSPGACRGRCGRHWEQAGNRRCNDCGALSPSPLPQLSCRAS